MSDNRGNRREYQMIVKVILVCLIAEASALCPIGFKYDKINHKCHENTGDIGTESCPNCILTDHLKKLTRRQINNVIRPSRADIQLLTDQFKYAVKNFVDGEGMIDSYLCPSRYRYDFDKKRCMPPTNSRRYLELGQVDCPYCHLKREKPKRYRPVNRKVIDLFDIPVYVAKGKKSVADIIDKVLRMYP